MSGFNKWRIWNHSFSAQKKTLAWNALKLWIQGIINSLSFSMNQTDNKTLEMRKGTEPLNPANSKWKKWFPSFDKGKQMALKRLCACLIIFARDFGSKVVLKITHQIATSLELIHNHVTTREKASCSCNWEGYLLCCEFSLIVNKYSLGNENSFFLWVGCTIIRHWNETPENRMNF